MPNFMLVSLNARFLLKIDLICLAKAQISCAVTAQLISAFVFATQIVQFLLQNFKLLVFCKSDLVSTQIVGFLMQRLIYMYKQLIF